MLYKYGDKQKIRQVMFNLLDNAVKFTDLESSRAPVSVVASINNNVNNDHSRKHAVISVKDTGEGIDKDIFPRLFSKFATKSDSGVGLGLFI
jgi:signal transduction histidine kinase